MGVKPVVGGRLLFSSTGMGKTVQFWRVTPCPYCQTPIRMDAPECPACRITFPRTSALVGALPRLTTVVADTTGKLKKSTIRKVNKEILRIQRRYPQALDHLLEMSSPAFQSGKWELGMEIMPEGLERLLESVTVVDETTRFGEGDY